MTAYIRTAMADQLVKIDESRDAAAMLDDSFPVTELVLKFTSADENGVPTELTEVISGESAEYLPHIMERIEAFLGRAGFATRLDVVGAETSALGDALHNLIVLEQAA